MKLLDGEVLPGETVEVDGDLKKGEMTFERAKAGRRRGNELQLKSKRIGTS